MARSASYNKAPPLLSASKSYSDWKKLINLWQTFTTLEKAKQGPALVLSLEGKAQEAALELDSKDISGEDGVKAVLIKLDKIYEKDKLIEKYNAIEKFETYKRSKETSIRDFLAEFDKRLHKTQSYKTTMSEDLKAYRLLKSANLDANHEKLIKATVSDLNYDEVRSKLIKIFSEDSFIPINELGSLSIKEEPTFHTSERDAQDIPEDDERYFTEDEESTYYTKQNRSGYKFPYRQSSTFNRNRIPHNKRDSPSDSSNWRQEQPEKKSVIKYAKNPVDKNGRITRCSICESVNHWHQSCPDKPLSGNETYMVHEILLHQNEIKDQKQLQTLVAETWNCGILDSGASKTVCGEKWLEEFIESLSLVDREKVQYYSSKSIYKFGDGERIQANGGARIPAFIGETAVQINTDIVTKELPLLLSKSFMKRANIVLDFKNDKASILNKEINLMMDLL